MSGLSIEFSEVEGFIEGKPDVIFEVTDIIDQGRRLIRGKAVGKSGMINLHKMLAHFSGVAGPREAKIAELAKAVLSTGVRQIRIHSTKPVVEQFTEAFKLPDVKI